MFTGLVQTIGVVETITPGAIVELWLRASFDSPYVQGESIAMDGCCLTVVESERDCFRVQATPETLRRTSLARLRPGSRVNLERALRLGDRLGGHMVQGHVDGVSQVLAKAPEGGSLLLTFELPAALAPFFVEKGSVTVDGVSLTVNSVGKDRFQVALIPETQERTTLAEKKLGDLVNLEADVIGKYVARLFGLRRADGQLFEETLRAAGFGAKE